MLGVVRHLDAPVEGGARDRQIPQAAFHEADDLVAARVRPDEIGLAFVQREQPVLIGGELEEVALLLDPLDRRALRTAAHIVLADDGFLLGVIGFVAHRIPAGIDVDIDVAVLLHPVPDHLHRLVMRGLGGADEAVERNVEALVHLLEPAARCASPAAAVGHSLGLGGLDHLLAVLVGAGQEEDVLAVEPLKARQRIGRDRLIGVADMRLAIRIGDRGRDVIDVAARWRRCRNRCGPWLRCSRFGCRWLRRGGLGLAAGRPFAFGAEAGWLAFGLLRRLLDRLLRSRACFVAAFFAFLTVFLRLLRDGLAAFFARFFAVSLFRRASLTAAAAVFFCLFRFFLRRSSAGHHEFLVGSNADQC